MHYAYDCGHLSLFYPLLLHFNTLQNFPETSLLANMYLHLGLFV